MGYEAGHGVASGDVVFVGYQSGKRASGTGNTAMGYRALYGADSTAANNTGTSNTAIGQYALNWFSKTIASTAVGAEAGYYSTGSYNTFLGYRAGLGSITSAPYSSGQYNTAIGQSAMQNMTSAVSNVAVGNSALQDITSATSNVGVGLNAGAI